ncbi:LysR substrate-binding domain-containing protein [Xanthomonas arboricola]|uniref:LysR substrate-binding domain-containing protein n=1 Tax=Xanthomonas arboricola TaxID=56448 RepID=UPI001430FBDB|nr:LysR substrate-binding domain-containing protein [Xanthomonas arboricola]NJB94680.1 DNA-binding transcriptional LysR family regulator [Xanthomonas arboricola]
MACALTDFRDKPAGTIRITTAGHAADAYIWPGLSNVLPDYPDLKIEVTVDYGLADIVAERYDIGIRLGDQVAKDMIAVPISPMQRMAVVAVPDYVRAPHHPHRAGRAGPAQLHRLAPAHPWWPAALGFRKGRPRGQGARGRPWTFNGSSAILRAALAGGGPAFLPETMALGHIAAGRLRRVLEDWCEPFDGSRLLPQPPPILARTQGSDRCVAARPGALTHSYDSVGLRTG